MRRFYLYFGVVVILGLLVIVASAISMLSVDAQEGKFKATPLLKASYAEIHKAALDYTQSRFQIRGPVKILLTQ